MAADPKFHDPIDGSIKRPYFHPDKRSVPPFSCVGCKNIVPDDDASLEYIASEIYVGIAGNITVVGYDGYEATYLDFSGRIPVSVWMVLENSSDEVPVVTTADNIVAEW